MELKVTYVGGPTALLETGGVRLLTDPTFDPADRSYQSGPVVLRKLAGPAIPPEAIGRVHAVLLSHDHHADNLDDAGRKFLPNADAVFTTVDGAARLGGNAVGLKPWDTIAMKAPGGRVLQITATPARHGPPKGDRGPVIGFVLAFEDAPKDAVYISGDTVWYEGVAEIASKFEVSTALLFLGAARVNEIGPAHLTMTAEDAVKAMGAFRNATTVVPLHFHGWAHFSESREQIARAFVSEGVDQRVRWPEPGESIVIAGLPPTNRRAHPA